MSLTVKHTPSGGPADPTALVDGPTYDNDPHNLTGQLPLENGGTNANLTASIGGILYSTASQLAILAGTATGGQIIRSTASAAPTWSLATYPNGAAAGTVLAAGSLNAITGTSTPTLGVAGSLLGSLALAGNTSGTVTIQPQAAAGTYNFNLPTTAGSSGQPMLSGGGGAAAMTFGTLGMTGGGTGLATLNQGDLIYGSASNTFSALAKDANATRYLSNTGSSNNPAWAQVNLANGVTGNLPVGNLNGGSGASNTTFWRGDGTWVAPPGTGTVTSATIDGLAITVSGTAPPRPGYANATLAVSAAGSALTIALKDYNGSDPSATSPSAFWFRSATGTTGTWTLLNQTSAMSLVISSGSTLGVTSSTGFRLWVVMFNDAGTLRLGVINCGGVALPPHMIASSTAEGGAGAADNAATFYTGTAVTSKPFVIIGYLEWSSSGLTAGTWTTTNFLYSQSFGPGVNKPGEIVQVARGVTTSITSNSTTSYVATGAFATLTPTSAANKIVWAFSGLATAANGSTATPLVQMNRSAGSSASTGTAIGPVVFQTNQNNAAAQCWWLATATDVDSSHNSASTLSYTVCLKSSTANSTSFPEITNGAQGNVWLMEIMS